jgi:hypothetical protein
VAIDKTLLRLDIIHAFGADFEDLLEKAKLEIAKNEGAKVALKTAQAKVTAICNHVEKDFEEGVLTKLISGDESGEQPLAAYVKRKIMQCASAVENLNAIVALNKIRAEGEVTAYKAVFALTQKKYEDAKAKAEYLARVASGELEEDDTPARSPAEDIRARKEESRKAKEAAAEEAPAEEAAEPTKEAESEAKPEPDPKPAPKPAKKGKSRKK